jgi:hypothetical protein
MANETDQAAGSAIAAFTLAQWCFWHLLKEGLLPKVEAERMLREGVEANKAGGPGNQIAAAMLAEVLKHVQAHQPPKKH